MKHKNQYYTVWVSVTDEICDVCLRTRLRHNKQRENKRAIYSNTALLLIY